MFSFRVWSLLLHCQPFGIPARGLGINKISPLWLNWISSDLQHCLTSSTSVLFSTLLKLLSGKTAYFFPEHIHSLTYSQGLYRAFPTQATGDPCMCSLLLSRVVPYNSSHFIGSDFFMSTFLAHQNPHVCMDSSFLLCSGDIISKERAGAIVWLTLGTHFFFRDPSLVLPVFQCQKTVTLYIVLGFMFFFLNGGRHISYQWLHHILKWNPINWQVTWNHELPPAVFFFLR